VCKGLKQAGHQVILLDVFFGTEEDNLFEFAEFDIDKEAARMKELSACVAEELKKRNGIIGPRVLAYCMAADVVFMALHGSNGEDGKIQGMFEVLGIPFTGSDALGSALAMDKGITRQMLSGTSVPMANGFCLHKDERENADLAVHGVSFPCVVKPACGGSSVGVSIAQDIEAYEKALDEAFALEDCVIVENYIKGREFSIGVLDGKALPIIEIAPIEGFYDYKNKYEPGKTKDTCPAELPVELTKKMQQSAEEVHHILRLRAYSRVDFLLDENGQHYCLEANTLPGMTPTSLLPQEAAVIGMDFPTLCDTLIQLSLKK